MNIGHIVPAVIGLMTSGVASGQGSIGIFDGQTSIGRVTGSASYDPQRHTYAIIGSGRNMWNDRDDFHFVLKRMTGNFDLTTRARFIGAGEDPHRKTGWTIRESLVTNSPHVTAALHRDGLADAARRLRSKADHQRRVQQLVSAHLTGRKLDRVHRFSTGVCQQLDNAVAGSTVRAYRARCSPDLDRAVAPTPRFVAL